MAPQKDGSNVNTAKSFALHKVHVMKAAYERFRNETVQLFSRFSKDNSDKVKLDLDVLLQTIDRQSIAIRQLQSQIESERALLRKQRETLAANDRDMDLLRTKSTSRKTKNEELKRKLAHNTQETEDLRSELARQRKHYEALFQTKADHLRAYGQIVQTSMEPERLLPTHVASTSATLNPIRNPDVSTQTRSGLPVTSTMSLGATHLLPPFVTSTSTSNVNQSFSRPTVPATAATAPGVSSRLPSNGMGFASRT